MLLSIMVQKVSNVITESEMACQRARPALPFPARMDGVHGVY